MKTIFTFIILVGFSLFLHAQDKSLNKQNILPGNNRLGISEVELNRQKGVIQEYHERTQDVTMLGNGRPQDDVYDDDDPEIDELTQGTYKNDSTIYLDVDQALAWTDNNRYLYNYNESDLLTEIVTQVVDTSGNWENQSRVKYTHDGNNYLVTSVFQAWVDSNGTWANMTLQDSSVYNGNGKQVKRYSAVWDPDTLNWDFTSAKFLGYDSNNVLIADTSLTFSLQQWNITGRKLYYYNIDGSIDLTDDEPWSGSVFNKDLRNYYYYDDEDHPDALTEIWTGQWNGSYYDTRHEILYSYNALGMRTSETRRDYISFNWEYQYRNIYNYNLDGNLEYEINQVDNFGYWENNNRTTYYYGQGYEYIKSMEEGWDNNNSEWQYVTQNLRVLDQNENVIEEISQDAGFTPVFSPSEKEIFLFDPSGKIVKGIFYSLNNVTEQWELDGWVMIGYTDKGQLEELVTQAWSNYLQAWINIERTLYHYNPKGDKIESLYFWWNEDAERWEFEERQVFIYDAQGIRIKKVYDIEGNLAIEEDINLLYDDGHRKTERIYDSANQVVTKIDYSWSDGNWVPGNRSKFAYDSIGNLVEESMDYYDEFSFYWYSDQLVTYSYNTDTLLIGILVEQEGEGLEPVSRTMFEYDEMKLLAAVTYEDFDWFEWDWMLGSRDESYWSEIENYCGISILVADSMLPSCPGDQDGSIVLRAIGGSAPYSYYFNGGEGSNDTRYAGLSGDVYYTFTVIDVSGCSLTDSVKLSNPMPISITVDKSDTDQGAETGFATAVVEGGTAPFSYLWTSGVETETAANLGSGLYFVTVTDSRGCTNNAVAAINDLGGPTIQIQSISDVSCFGEMDGTIDIEVAGVEPFTYTWSTGSQSQDIESLSAGPYEVRVEDGNGLVSVQSITVLGPEEIVLEVETTDASCGGSDGTAIVNVSGGGGAFAYLWSTGGTGMDIGGLTAGAYDFTVTDQDGCTLTTTVAISEAGASEVVIDSVLNTDCGQMNGGVFLSVPGAVDPLTYMWSDGSEEEDLSGADVGSYYVTVTNISGCITVVSAEVVQQDPAVNPICIVTVDSLTNTNLLAWERVQTSGIESYNVYRESSQKDVYFLVGTVPVSEETLFNDETADPSIRSYRYKLTAVDSCGNESEFSIWHKTMHLTLNLGLDNSVNLIWDGYEGFDVSTYDILRFSDSNGWEKLESVSSNVTSYSDFSPPFENLFYVVEVMHPAGGCTTTELKAGTLNSSRSNRQSKLREGTTAVAPELVADGKVNVYPTLTTGIVNIEWKEMEGRQLTLEVHDLTGAVVFNKKYEHLAGTDFSGQIDLSFTAKGVYLLRMASETGYSVARVIIE